MTLADRAARAPPARPRAVRRRRASASLPELVREAGGERAFVVTDPGVVRSGVAARVVEVLEADGHRRRRLFDEVEPNPGTLDRRARLGRAGRRSGWTARSSSRSVAARRWTRPRSWPCTPRTAGEVLALGYHRDDLAARACPVIAVPTTAGHRRRDQHLRRHHRRGGRAQGLRRASVGAAALVAARPGADRRRAAGRDRPRPGSTR